MALPKKVYSVKTPFLARLFSVYGIFNYPTKSKNSLCPNQKFATALDFSCSWSLSAMRAMNSELVGLPLVLLTV